MKEPLVLTFDVGSQSVKALVINKYGKVLAVNKKKFGAFISPTPQTFERSTDEVWNTITSVSKELFNQNPQYVDDITVVTMTTIRDSIICLDSACNPLTNIITYLDTRVATKFSKTPLWKKMAIGLVGMSRTLEVQKAITRSNYIIQYYPEIWAKTAKYVVLSSWLNFKFVGILKDSSSNQVGHIPFDYKKKKWKSIHDIQFEVFNLEKINLSIWLLQEQYSVILQKKHGWH